MNSVQYRFGKPSSYALAQEVAEHAVTLVRDENPTNTPLSARPPSRVLIKA